jgi:hypothetical protein
VAEAAFAAACLGVVQELRPGGPGQRSGEQDHQDEDQLLINNRQNGRRRGRGGGPRSPNQGPNIGNRQDNRSRGNAAQLLEKYKSLARDAQLQGDRVQSEYWLQFAEHYYRVLNETRARFEEQRRPRDDFYSDEDEEQDEAVHAAGDNDDEGDERDERPYRAERQGRSDRQDRPERPDRDRQDRGDRPRRDFRAERNGEYRPERRPRDERPREDRRDVNGEAPMEAEGERIALDVLPPAISVVEGDSSAKPRRRTRRPRTDEGGEEIAPAA